MSDVPHAATDRSGETSSSREMPPSALPDITKLDLLDRELDATLDHILKAVDRALPRMAPDLRAILKMRHALTGNASRSIEVEFVQWHAKWKLSVQPKSYRTWPRHMLRQIYMDGFNAGVSSGRRERTHSPKERLT
ncbi:hypothetical protein HED60_15095 [Planctomycetales bacterium ZRK34]|nr:hypothetical protein HED60_15095 [Planctomycetales bacterium ZRK34]